MAGAAPGTGGARAVVARKVAWADTDASGRHHFTAVMRWVEEAEVALYEEAGVADELGGRLPRVHFSADYALPLWFRDLVEVSVEVVAVGRSSITLAFEVAKAGAVAASGRYVIAYVDGDGRSVALPPAARRALAPA